MKTIKVSEVTPIQLNWLVAKCEGVRVQYDSREGLIINDVAGWIPYRPSVAWWHGGPIIEREEIGFAKYGPNGSWKAVIGETPRGSPFYGPTPLIAAMRCYVASKLGDVVEVPEELT